MAVRGWGTANWDNKAGLHLLEKGNGSLEDEVQWGDGVGLHLRHAR